MASTKGLTQAEVDVKIARPERREDPHPRPLRGHRHRTSSSRPRKGSTPAANSSPLVDISRIKVKPRCLESEVAGRLPAARSTSSSAPSPAGLSRAVSRPSARSSQRRGQDCAVHVTMDNPSEEVKPGMHAEIEIPTEIFKDRLLVPQQGHPRPRRPQARLRRRGGHRQVALHRGRLENERFAEVLPARSRAGASPPAIPSSSRATSPWPTTPSQHRRIARPFKEGDHAP